MHFTDNMSDESDADPNVSVIDSGTNTPAAPAMVTNDCNQKTLVEDDKLSGEAV